jgi:hypothetical protein
MNEHNEHIQKRHHGVEIPAEQQPRCEDCGGHMSVHNYSAIGEWWWSCLSNSCDGAFKQHGDWPFADWFGDFCSVPAHEMMRERAREAGLSRNHGIDDDGQLWFCVDSPAWGGNHCANRHQQEDGSRSELFWTGFRGEVAEEWVKVV